MSKTNEKRQIYNAEILKALAEKYGISEDYIRKCLRKDRTGIMPDKICKEYKEGVDALTKTVDQFKHN